MAAWLPWDTLLPWRVDYHMAIAKAHRLLGQNNLATSHYRMALSLDGNLGKAHNGLATLRMPGDNYLIWLGRFYADLAPETIIEIGVSEGGSLSLVRPPTLAIGVDPQARVLTPFNAETHIFAETSDAFFARRGPDSLLAGRPLGVGFIDGLHLFEQALRDFTNLERYCGPRSIILLHDTVPLDQVTQSRVRDTHFHTGDVWKAVLCLKRYRPELDIFTIATPPTGLTVVTGLASGSRVLAHRYDEAVNRFVDTPFSDIQNRLDDALNIVKNNWEVVARQLRARGII